MHIDLHNYLHHAFTIQILDVSYSHYEIAGHFKDVLWNLPWMQRVAQPFMIINIKNILYKYTIQYLYCYTYTYLDACVLCLQVELVLHARYIHIDAAPRGSNAFVREALKELESIETAVGGGAVRRAQRGKVVCVRYGQNHKPLALLWFAPLFS
jgi:hypothetical protein